LIGVFLFFVDTPKKFVIFEVANSMITNQADDYNSCSEEMMISTKEIYLGNY